MTSGDLYELFRSDVVDDVTPYMWTDKEVFAYMNDAYYMFVRMTGGIPDGDSRVTRLSITSGQATTPISEKVMRIRQAYTQSNDLKLKIINVQDIENLTTEDYGVIRAVGNLSTAGEVRYMIIGESEDYVRWVHVPTTDDVVQMTIERLPLDDICDKSHDLAGVRSEHHFHLLKWMRHLAYRKQDTDKFDLIKSDQEERDFLAYCDMAKREKGIRRHKVRTTSYGGY